MYLMPTCSQVFFAVFNVFFSHCKVLLNIAEKALYKYFIISIVQLDNTTTNAIPHMLQHHKGLLKYKRDGNVGRHVYCTNVYPEISIAHVKETSEWF